VVVIGSYAAVMLGIDVATDDVDVEPAHDRTNLERLAGALRELRAVVHVAHAHAAVDAAKRAAEQLPVASRRAGWLRARGLLTDDAAPLLEAVVLCRRSARPVDLALCLRDAAVALARAGRHAQARPLATESVQLLAALGADGDQRQARAQLRAAGLPLGPRARHTRTRHGWGSLTEAELRVLRLAAQGRSNPEIARALYLSRRTVGWHLSNVFRKLGLSSRGELVVEMMRHELG
jgi:DNA-binding CsgD family transcriptional regulator